MKTIVETSTNLSKYLLDPEDWEGNKYTFDGTIWTEVVE